jgi:hypothetical protein
VANTIVARNKSATLFQVALGTIGTSNISLQSIVDIATPNQTYQPLLFESLSNASTSNTSGVGYIQPPPPQDFTNLTAANYACLSSTTGGGSLCLPNGTYSNMMTGKYGFTVRKATDMALPAGALLNFTTQTFVQTGGLEASPFRYQNVLYTSNVSASTDPQFSTDISDMSSTPATATFNIVIPPSIPVPPTACIFSAVQYGGDVACFRIGGTNLTAQYQRMAQSIMLYGNASVYMYAQFYGDIGGVSTTTSVPDLSALAYSTGNLQNKVVALWIHSGV